MNYVMIFSVIKKYFFKEPYDVVFYYPQHFNRGVKSNNPYFERLLNVCIKNDLKYFVIEEPDRTTKFNRNKDAFKFDFWFYLIIALRKSLPNCVFKSYYVKEVFIGKSISFLSFNFFKANNYITISNSMINVLCGLNTKANVYDLQHGIIYSWHWGYFDKNGFLNDYLRPKQIKFLVYGNGFKEVFFRNPNNYDYKSPESIAVVGNVLNEIDSSNAINFSKVLYTLQITDDLSDERIKVEIELLIEFLESIAIFFVENHLILILKSHPRFSDKDLMISIEKQFSFVQISEDRLDDLANTIFLHITKSSTSVFELARQNIPTLLINNESGIRIFIEEYNYPIEIVDLCQQVQKYVDDKAIYRRDQKKVREWVSKFYESFNEEVFIGIIRNTNGKKN